MGVVTTVGLTEKLLLFATTSVAVWRFFGLDYGIALAALFIAYIVLWIRDKQSFWEKRGVPGPPPTFLFGNTREIKKEGMLTCMKKWTKDYGLLYGVYNWMEPELYVADANLLKKILVTDFKNFANRRIRRRAMGSGTIKQTSIYDHMLVFLDSSRWKDVRNTITPAFTSLKLRQMTPLLEDSMVTLEEILSEYSDQGKAFDAKKLFLAFTMDAVAKVALATDVHAQKDPNNKVLACLQRALTLLMTPTRTRFSGIFPWTASRLDKVWQIRREEDFFWNSLFRVIKERRTNPKKAQPDFLQLLINASAGDTAGDEGFQDEYIDKVKGGQKVALSDTEILAQCVLFLVAGHETTAACLAFTFYSLAQHPECQQKLYDEILNIAGEDGNISWEMVQNKLHYLEAVVLESLRMYPPTTSIGRLSASDYDLKEGLTIPQGMTVTVPFYAMHHHEKYYYEPEKFNPERFMREQRTKRNPLTFLPFGYGPRNCIGQRFGLVEVKYCLANIVRNYKILCTPETEPEPLGVRSDVLLHSQKPIYLTIQKRQQD